MSLAPTFANTMLDASLVGSLTLALYTSPPTGDSAGTEVGGTGYARVAIAFNSASSQAADNNGAVTYAVALAAWGLVTDVCIYVSTARKHIIHLDTARNINLGDQLSFPDKTLVVTP